MRKEERYDFRKKLLMVHEPNLRNPNRKVTNTEFFVSDGSTISISSTAGKIIQNAAEDFVDFLSVSMNVSAVLVKDSKATIEVSLALDKNIDLGEAKRYKGFMIDATEKGISIYAHDDRGAAQALYYIEDMMTLEKSPVFEIGNIIKYPMFSPQIVHSGYGLEEFPDNYLARIAHEGRDAIVFDVGNQERETLESLNDLIQRALCYGIDVYAYIEFQNGMHPREKDAEKYYEKLYGSIIDYCPETKGIILVGESLNYPSCDPHVSIERAADGGIPSNKTAPGWYPCYDYPELLSMIKKVLHKRKKDIDIVFWTYNWSTQSEEARIKLIENLPEGISLAVTYDMPHKKDYGGAIGRVADYSLSCVGPSDVFLSEAVAAKKRNIPLYSFTNTGGLSWDFGVIPYEPMPYQWINRFYEMRKSHDDLGLCGLIESHHYGFYPSFISKLAKLSFFEPRESMENILENILKANFGEENYEEIDRAMHEFSTAISYCIPSDEDQYGAFRVGPSYPFWLTYHYFTRIPNLPPDEDFPDGSHICSPFYMNIPDENVTPCGIRINYEIKFLKTMLEHMELGLKCLLSVKNTNEKVKELINLIQFMINTIKTGIHMKEWYILQNKRNLADTHEAFKKVLDDMEALLLDEIENAKQTIPLVERDSRLGWEPYMHYVTDRKHLEWKIRQVHYVIDVEIEALRKGLEVK